MKTLPILSLLLLSAGLARADGLTTKIDGFLDIPWGVNEDSVKKNFPNRSHARYDQVKSAPGKIWYIGGKFAKMKVRSFMLDFVNDHFWVATTIFDPQSKDHTKEYAEIKQLLIEKYGPPETEEDQGIDHIANWHIGEDPAARNRIELRTESRGPGLHIMYAADGLKKTFIQPPTPAAPPVPGTATTPAKPVASAKPATPKPLSTAPGAKDDL